MQVRFYLLLAASYHRDLGDAMSLSVYAWSLDKEAVGIGDKVCDLSLGK